MDQMTLKAFVEKNPPSLPSFERNENGPYMKNFVRPIADVKKEDIQANQKITTAIVKSEPL